MEHRWIWRIPREKRLWLRLWRRTMKRFARCCSTRGLIRTRRPLRYFITIFHLFELFHKFIEKVYVLCVFLSFYKVKLKIFISTVIICREKTHSRSRRIEVESCLACWASTELWRACNEPSRSSPLTTNSALSLTKLPLHSYSRRSKNNLMNVF